MAVVEEVDMVLGRHIGEMLWVRGDGGAGLGLVPIVGGACCDMCCTKGCGGPFHFELPGGTSASSSFVGLETGDGRDCELLIVEGSQELKG